MIERIGCLTFLASNSLLSDFDCMTFECSNHIDAESIALEQKSTHGVFCYKMKKSHLTVPDDLVQLRSSLISCPPNLLILLNANY